MCGAQTDVACLAQSPQLYKQMAVTSDLFKVFEIGHVFRAENSNTHRHMCEFIGLDFEMEVKEHYREITTVLGDCFTYIFDNLNKHCAAELAAVQCVRARCCLALQLTIPCVLVCRSKQFPFEPLKYSKETLIFPFSQAVQMLRESGEELNDYDDLKCAAIPVCLST